MVEIRVAFELHDRTWYFNILHPELMGMGQPDCSCGGDACCTQYSQAFSGTIRGLETENVTIWPDDNDLKLGMICQRIGECYDKGVSDAKKFIESPEYSVVLPWVTDVWEGPPEEIGEET